MPRGISREAFSALFTPPLLKGIFRLRDGVRELDTYRGLFVKSSMVGLFSLNTANLQRLNFGQSAGDFVSRLQQRLQGSRERGMEGMDGEGPRVLACNQLQHDMGASPRGMIPSLQFCLEHSHFALWPPNFTMQFH